MIDKPVEFVKWEPEFTEIVSHIHFEQIAPRRQYFVFDFDEVDDDEEEM